MVEFGGWVDDSGEAKLEAIREWSDPKRVRIGR